MTSVSRWHKCAEGIQSLIATALAALQSPNNLASERVVIRETPWQTTDLVAPGVLLVPVPETNTPATNVRDDEGHGVGVIIFKKSDRATAADDQLHYWRDIAKQAVRNKRIDSASVHLIDIEPRTVIDPSSFGQHYAINSFTARCFIRTT